MGKSIRQWLAGILSALMIFSLIPLTSYAEPLAVWSGNVAQGFDSGSGTESDPYVIKTPEQLAYLSASVKARNAFSGVYFKLDNDIYLNDVSEWSDWANNAPENIWTPIGYYWNCPFMGIFNGDGHAIHGVFINDEEVNYAGLFGYFKGTVMDLSVEQSLIAGNVFVGGICGENSGSIINCGFSGAVSGDSYVGGICGDCLNNSRIENCYNTGTVTGSSRVGGICGLLLDSGNVSHCCNSGTVTGKESSIGGICGASLSSKNNISECYNTGLVSGQNRTGGIIGYLYFGTVERCYNSGTIQGDSEGTGGICGYNTVNGKVINCYNSGSIKGSTMVGGIVGVCDNGGVYYNGGVISNSYSAGQVRAQYSVGSICGAFTYGGYAEYCYYLSGTAADGSNVVQNGVGSKTKGQFTADVSGQTTALSESQMREASSFPGFDFDTIWTIGAFADYGYPTLQWQKTTVDPEEVIWDGSVASGFDSGSGTESDPYVIKTAEQLAYLASAVNAGNTYSGVYFVLACDIKLNDTDQWEEWEYSAPANVWIPIGNGYYAFEGNFNGDGHAIHGVFINDNDEEANYAGLFGVIIGTVMNLSVEQSLIAGYEYVGGICGAGGSIINCGFSGAVSGYEYVGGICGYVYYGGSIINCGFSAAVSGYSSVGGICGYNSGSIINCGFSGAVSGFQRVGGICGNCNGRIENCYNTGTVTGSSYVGGICGGLEIGNVSHCYSSGTVTGTYSAIGGICGSSLSYKYNTISDCYNTGLVSGQYTTGGIIGYLYLGTVERCYNSGTITGKGYYIGGICGCNYAKVSNCYNLGSINGGYEVGGIVGVCEKSSVISNSYSAGQVRAQYSVGSIYGVFTYGCTVKYCYYLSGTAVDGSNVVQKGAGSTAQGKFTADISGQTTALSESQMREASSFPEFDFDNTWTIGAFADYGYPTLQWQTDMGVQPPHTHSYVEIIDDQYLASHATCTSRARYYYVCSECGAKGTETFEYGDYAPHTFVHYGAKAAKCSEPGHNAYDVCSVCGYSTYVYIPATGHKYVLTVEKEATCTEDGMIKYTCSSCGDTYRVTTAHGEHDYVTEYVAPTCTEDGLRTYICSKCGYERHEIIPASHSYKMSVVKKATRDEDGLIKYTCSVCGDTYYQTIPARENGTVLLVQDTAPWSENNAAALLNNLLNDGCIDGYDVISSSDLASTDLGEYNVIYIVNDQTTYTYNTLATVHAKLTEFVEAGGVLVYGACDHGWQGGNITAALPGDVTKSNYYSMHNYIVDTLHPVVSGAFTDGQALTNDLLLGTYCSHTYFNTDTLPNDANIILTDANGNPTLVEYPMGEGTVILSGLTWEFYYTRIYRGNTTYSKCVFDDLIVYALSASKYVSCDHEYGEGVVVPATCDTDGYTEHTCSKCGKKYKDNIVPAYGHQLGEWIIDRKASCSEDGLMHQVCATCGEYVTYVTPATGHTWSDGYTSDGNYHWRVCTVCGEAGRKYSHTGGTCTCDEKAVCEVCGTTYGDTLPHTFTAMNTDAKYLKSAATCTSKAVYYYSCSECGAKGTATFEYGDTLPHTFTAMNTDAKYLKSAATTEAPAQYYYSCVHCGATGTESFEYGDCAPHTFVHYEKTVIVKDNAILTDGETGFTGGWGEVGTSKVLLITNSECTEKPMEVTVIHKLEEAKKITGITLDLYHDANVMIGYPEGKAVISVSTDGETYTEVGEFDLAAAEVALDKHGTVSNKFTFDEVEAKFVKIVLNVGSNAAVLGGVAGYGTEAYPKVNWEFIAIAEVAVVEATVVVPTYSIGDVNDDGEIDAADYILIKRHIIGNKLLTGDQLKAADINDDGEVDAADYILVKRHIIGNKLIPGVK